MKPCVTCKSIERYSDGRCKACARAASAAWSKANPDKDKARISAWRSANHEKDKARNAAWKSINKDMEKATAAAYRKANPHKRNALTARRKAEQLQATPIFANKFFVEEIYDLAQRRTKSTGLKWEVDHVVPLKSNMVCGLHVEHNLRVIPATLNKSKGNRHWPGMPPMN